MNYVKQVGTDLCIVGCALFVLPAAIVLAIWALLYGWLIVPLIVGGVFLWRFLKKKGYMDKVHVPRSAKPYVPKPKKPPIMVHWGGKQIPLWYMILSIILSIILVPVLLYLVLLVIPPLWSVLIIGFIVGKSIGKKVK